MKVKGTSISNISASNNTTSDSNYSWLPAVAATISLSGLFYTYNSYKDRTAKGLRRDNEELKEQLKLLEDKINTLERNSETVDSVQSEQSVKSVNSAQSLQNGQEATPDTPVYEFPKL